VGFRIALIRQIEEAREWEVICYVTGDRQGAPLAQIGEDAVRPMYSHLRALGADTLARLDLYLYSRGGSGDLGRLRLGWRRGSGLLRHLARAVKGLTPGAPLRLSALAQRAYNAFCAAAPPLAAELAKAIALHVEFSVPAGEPTPEEREPLVITRLSVPVAA